MSKRAKALIASVVAASVGGFAIFSGGHKVHDDTMLAIKLLQPWEGRHLTAYLDKIAKPPVWTICDGDTDNVRAGMVETHEGCDKRLAIKLERDYRAPVAKCAGDWDDRPLSWRGSVLAATWNIGVGATCRSTFMKLAKQGRYEEACEAATAWNKAGGVVVRGLDLRRKDGDANRIGERELCLAGLGK